MVLGPLHALISVFAFVFAACKTQKVHFLNDHYANLSAPHIRDRFGLYSPEPDWVIGRGRRVAIVDVGMPKNDSFFRCLRVERERKVVLEVDTTGAGAPKTTEPAACDDDRRDYSASSSFFERPMISNHLTKSIVYGFYIPEGPAAPRVPKGMAIARGVQIVSIFFRKRLYVHESEKHKTRSKEKINREWAREYLESLCRATTWLVSNYANLGICCVQVSAVDGNGVAASFYADLAPAAYDRWKLNLELLRRAGVWISAPTGNQDVQDELAESLVYNWPANDPAVIGVGCYSVTTKKIIRQRGKCLDILVPTLEDHPPSSYCNTLAVSTGVTVRDLCSRNCGGDANCTASFILFAMQLTADVVKDAESRLKHYALNPDRLFRVYAGNLVDENMMINGTTSNASSSSFCDDAAALRASLHKTVSSRLDFQTKYFRSSYTSSTV